MLACTLLALSLPPPSDAEALAPEPASANPAAPSGLRTETLSLKRLAGDALTLRGVRDERRLHVGVRLDERVASARLVLDFTPSAALLARLSQIEVRLNDEQVASLPLTAEMLGQRQTREIELDPRLFIEDNWIALRFSGHYTLDCEDPFHSSLWTEFDGARSQLVLGLAPLAIKSELAMLPAPWFDRRDNGPLELPFTLSAAPDVAELRGAAVLASWFGALAGERGTRLQVLRDLLPSRRGIVFDTPLHPAPAALRLGPVTGPSVNVVDHPEHPGVKLLVVRGRDSDELARAATQLTLGRQGLAGESATFTENAVPAPRAPYDAPRWAGVTGPVRVADLVPWRDALQIEGIRPGTVNIDWRTPPDLWEGPGHRARLDLRYRATVAPSAADSLMTVGLNGQFVRAWRMPASTTAEPGWVSRVSQWFADDTVSSGEVHTDLTGLAARGSNRLEVNMPLGIKPQSGSCAWGVEPTRAAVDGDSTLDLSSLPHRIDMPDLAAFAQAGWPFSRQADLARTALVLPALPSDGELVLALQAVAAIGRATGATAHQLVLATPQTAETARERDLLVVGRAASELIARWKPPGVPVETVRGARLYGFQSPLAAGRSVVALAAGDADAFAALANALVEPALRDQIRGAWVQLDGARVRSAEGGERYVLGELPWFTRARLALLAHPVAAGASALGLLLLAAMGVSEALRRRARRRLGGRE